MNRIIINHNKWFNSLCIFIILHEIFLCLLPSSHVSMNWINNIVGMIFMTISINVLSKKINILSLYKYWKLIGLIVMIGMLYQSIEVYMLHNTVSFIKIPLLPLSSKDVYDKILLGNSFRPVSFFTEPSHYCSFMLPLLFLNLLFKDKIYTLFNLLCIFLSASSLGIIMAVFFLISFSLKGNSIKYRIGLILFLLLCCFAYFYLSAFEIAREKMANVGEDESSSLRLFFGAQVWYSLPFDIKVLGIMYSNIAEFLTYNSKYIPPYLMWIINDDSSLSYQSSFWLIAIKFGFIGLFLYFGLFFNFKSLVKNFPLTIYVLYIATAPFYQSCFMNTIFITQMVLMFVLIKNKEFIYEKLHYNDFICK